MNSFTPAFVISLDFELHWGVSEHVHQSEHYYWNHIKGAREVIYYILDLFEKRNIHATWATVGFLFGHGQKDLRNFQPEILPQYYRSEVNNYKIAVGNSEDEDPYHFAPSLIQQIKNSPNQEIACHTFSHYFCDEPGQDSEAFKMDLSAARNIASRDNVVFRSLVFPRNQIMKAYLSLLPQFGIDIYRGNPLSKIYKPRIAGRNYLARAIRLIDSYVNLTGHHTVPWSTVTAEYPYNVRASRFLRPYSSKFKLLEPLRVRRVISDLRNAAKRGEIFHLWWHPHNMGMNIRENIASLNAILDEYDKLYKSYNMLSLTMSELVDLAKINT